MTNFNKISNMNSLEVKKFIKKFSPKGIKSQLIDLIQNKFGKKHNIKLVIFKSESEYNDEYTEYNPVLILIDENFNEIDHDINLENLIPDSETQYRIYEVLNKFIYVENITFTL